MFRNSELAKRTRLAKLIFTILVDNVDYGKNAKEITLLTFAREHFNHHVLRRYKVFYSLHTHVWRVLNLSAWGLQFLYLFVRSQWKIHIVKRCRSYVILNKEINSVLWNDRFVRYTLCCSIVTVRRDQPACVRLRAGNNSQYTSNGAPFRRSGVVA